MKENTITPVFIFSLPRSGSTLLQKILASHTQIATTSEPWLLLPFLSPLRKNGHTYSDYGYEASTNAIREYCDNLNHGVETYRQAIHDVAVRMYREASNKEAKFFLDKTPRYHLIVNEIIKTFPEAKFIFLWRHPLATASSLISTFNKGKWNLYRYKVDLFYGLHNLLEAYKQHQQHVFSLNYEDLVDPEKNDGELSKLFDYLGLEYTKSFKESFQNVSLQGNFGDPNIKSKRNISSASVNKWKENMNGAIRKRWAVKYVLWLGKERLDTMGYDLDTILFELKNMKRSHTHLFSDAKGYVEYILRPWIEPSLLKAKFRRSDSNFNVQHY